MKEGLTELKGEVDSLTMRVGNFSTLSIWIKHSDRRSKKKKI